MTDVLDEDLQGRPVVSIDGADVAQVRGLAHGDDEDDVLGLSLAKTGIFGGELPEILPWPGIQGIGPDAVVVSSPATFVLPEDLSMNGDRPSPTAYTEQPPTPAAVAGTDGAFRFSQARAWPVVSATDGEALGRVDRFVVDPATQRVSALRLDNVTGMQRYVSWRNITSFEPDAVTIRDAKALRLGDGPREEKVRRDYGMLGKRVLTDAGHELGKVTDVAFDPSDGSVTAVVLEDQAVAGDRLLGVGPYAVVVRH